MWNLTADDVQRAKEELKGRRAAIQARYEKELSQLEVDLGDLETFERFAVKFVSDFKGEEAPEAAVTEAAPAAESVVAEPSDPADPAAAVPADKVDAVAGADPVAGRRGASRWRMHLNSGEVSP